MAFGLSACSPTSGRQLNIYNYSNYIAPDSIANFTKSTHISVVYDEFSSQDVLFAKLKLGAGYDLVVATDYMLRRLIKHGVVAKIDGFAHKKAISPLFATPPWDPQLDYSVPFLWGTTGIGYNKTKVTAKPHSWSDLWDPQYADRMTMMDEKRDAIGVALIRLGYSGNSVDPRQLAEAKRSLMEQKRILRQYTTDYIDGLARNEIWLAEAWSGDAARAHSSNPDIDYCIPDEGSFVFVDSWCIPASAEHKQEAVEFLNYIMQPQQIAAVTNATGFPNTIESAKPLVNRELINNPLGYPPDDMLKRTIFQEDIGATEQLWDKIWGEVKFHDN